MTDLLPFVADLPLVDHHGHGVVTRRRHPRGLRGDAHRGRHTLAARHEPCSTPIGLAVRERCAPVLDLPNHAPAEAYLERRAALGAAEVDRRFLRSTGTAGFLLDGGFQPDALTTTREFAELAGARAHESSGWNRSPKR